MMQWQPSLAELPHGHMAAGRLQVESIRGTTQAVEDEILQLCVSSQACTRHTLTWLSSLEPCPDYTPH